MKKRMLVSGLGAAFLFGVLGCGGGNLQEGVPPDTKADVPLGNVKADMGAGKINPNKLPKGKDAEEAPAAK